MHRSSQDWADPIDDARTSPPVFGAVIVFPIGYVGRVLLDKNVWLGGALCLPLVPQRDTYHRGLNHIQLGTHLAMLAS